MATGIEPLWEKGAGLYQNKQPRTFWFLYHQTESIPRLHRTSLNSYSK